MSLLTTKDPAHRQWLGFLTLAPGRGAMLQRDLTLFWVSVLLLFFEILAIRWLSAEVRIFAYFHNLVLLFAFLGMGLGAALARKRAYLLLSFALMTVLVAILGLERHLDPFSIRDISTTLSQATGYLIWDVPGRKSPDAPLAVRLRPLLAGGGTLLFLMALITLFFVPFGQLLGRLFNAYDRPLRAYGVNLIGSLAGIWLFNTLSLLSLPPWVWFGLGGLGSLPLIRGRAARVLAGLLTTLSVLVLYQAQGADGWTVWSLYQKLTVKPATATIDGQPVQYGYTVLTNSTGYMQISNYSPQFVNQYPSAFPSDEVPYDHYNIPYRFAGRLDDVLVVGSGAGNDVAGALRNGARRVTAVDIDPQIIAIGRELHPEQPYSDPRVTAVNDDARSFFKRTAGRYDCIVFGLLDSHTLSSSYSNVRLDNYVYTVESFQEARRLLKPDGVMVLLFEVAESDDFIGARIQRMLTDAFGQQPVSFSIRSGFRGWGGTGFVVGNDEVIAQHLAADAHLRATVEKLGPTRERWAASDVSLTTDDWPYLYLDGRSIPPLYFLVFGILLLFSVVGVRAAYGRQQRMAWRFFFLGAGFMLLETQNISKLALIFGTTWVVNSVVISAILVMIFLANAYATRVPIASLTPYFVALFASLALNLAVPLGAFAALPPGLKAMAIGFVMGLPILFAGIIFSASFAVAEDRASMLASNLLGAMAGGVLETLSFLIGIKALLIVAAALYLLAMLARTSAVRPAVTQSARSTVRTTS
ncbi:MAG: methyltransferase domain-containing protein [Chloroflexota bacterium]|nr:methyltransferase domain-containing protein [Chloroflexota bacterium]